MTDSTDSTKDSTDSTKDSTDSTKDSTKDSTDSIKDSAIPSKDSTVPKEEFLDPSEKKANDLQKFSTEPLKIPGTDILEVEPKAALAATTIAGMFVDKLADPDFSKSIVDNIEKTMELSLETKKNKLEHLEKDTDLIKKSQSGGNVFFTEEECSFF